MQSITNLKTTRAETRPGMNDRARRSTPSPKPNSPGLSPEELRTLALEMIG